MSFLEAVEASIREALATSGIREVVLSCSFQQGSTNPVDTQIGFREVKCRLRNSFQSLEEGFARLRTVDLTSFDWETILEPYYTDRGWDELNLGVDVGKIVTTIQVIAGELYLGVRFPIVVTE